MANIKQTLRKIGKFFKKNGYIFLIIICIAAIGTMIGLAVANNNKPYTPPIDNNPIDNNNNNNNNNNDNNEDEVPVDVEITFVVPVSGGAVMDERVHEAFYFNQTLDQMETHMGVDFVSEGDSNVYAVCDGVVTEAGNEEFYGSYVIITHDDGYESRYYSLGGELAVIAGQTVRQGDVIGTMSDSYAPEYLDGVHLHFELYKDGVQINPLSVLITDDK